MRTKLISSLVLAVAGVVAMGGTLKVQVRSAVSQQVVNRKVTLTLTEAGPVTVGPWLLAGDWASQFTDTNGLTYFSNVLAGQYRLDIAGTPSRSFPFGMPDTNGLIDAAALIGTTNSEPLFYTAAQIDQLVFSGGGISVAATNGVVAATNGAVVTFGQATNDVLYVAGGGTVEVKRTNGTSVFKVDGDTGNIIGRGGLWQINGSDGSFFFAASAVSGSSSGIFAPLLQISGLTANRLMLTDGLKNTASAAASGAVPVDADGSAATFAQVNALAPGNILTNGMSVPATLSNLFSVIDAANARVDITNGTVQAAAITNRGNVQSQSLNTVANVRAGGNLSGSTFSVDNSGTVGGTLSFGNLTANRLMLTDGTKNASSAAASGPVPVDADGSATTFAQVNALSPGNVVTNGESAALTLSNQVAFVTAANQRVDITNGTVQSVAQTNRANIETATLDVTGASAFTGAIAFGTSASNSLNAAVAVQTTNAVFSAATSLKNGDVGLDGNWRWESTFYNSNRTALCLSFSDQPPFPGGASWLTEVIRQGRAHEGGLMSGGGDVGTLRLNTNGLVSQVSSATEQASAANIVFSGSPYWMVPNGGIITWDRIGAGTAIADTNHLCDTFKLFYIMEPNAGTFLLQTNIAGGGWNTMRTIDAHTASLTNGFVTNFTLTAGYYAFRVQGSSGTTRIWDAAVYSSTAKNYANGTVSTAGGTSFQTITNCQTNVWLTFMGGWNPDLILLQDTGGAANGPAVQYMDPFIPRAATNADRVYMGWLAFTPDNQAGNFALQQFATTNGNSVSYFDISSIWPTNDVADLISKGVMNADGIHVTTYGANIMDRMLWTRIMRSLTVTNGNLRTDNYAPLGIIAGNSIISTGSLAGLSFQQRSGGVNNWQWYTDSSGNPRLRQNSSPFEAMYFDATRFAWSAADVNGLPVALGITNIPYSILNLSNSITGYQSVGTDIGGVPITLSAGASTGTGRGGALIFSTTPSAAGSASAGNAQSTRTYISAKDVNLTETTATTVANVAIASSSTVGIRVFATTRANDASDFQVRSDSFLVTAENKAGTVVAGISTIGTGDSAVAVSTGTLTTTWTAVANGASVDIKCNATSSLTQTTLATRWRLEVDSPGVPTITAQ